MVFFKEILNKILVNQIQIKYTMTKWDFFFFLGMPRLV